MKTGQNNKAATEQRKSPRLNQVSSNKGSPRTGVERTSPNAMRKAAASPKGSPKGRVGQAQNGISGNTGGTGSGAKSGYNSTTSAKSKNNGVTRSQVDNKSPTGNSWNNSTKVKLNYNSSTSQKSQKSKIGTGTQNLNTTTATRGTKAGSNAAKVTAKSYGKKIVGPASATNKNAANKQPMFQQNVSKKIQGLQDLQIETYDAAKGRPSLMDVNNNQVFEGNYLPQSLQHLSDNTQKMGPNTQRSTGTYGAQSANNIHQQQQQKIVDDYNFQQQPFNQSGVPQGMKFKKKSQIQEDNLNKILENKARISINSQTGKHEFKYCQKSTSNLRPSQFDGQGYWQNSDSLVNYINDQNGGQLDNMAPIRPSNLIWQMPYDERKSYIKEQSELQFNRMSKAGLGGQNFGASAKFSDNLASTGGALAIGKEDSVGFQQASGSDSEFEHFDDYIDEAEEFNGASRAVKLSIRALNFNTMLADKQSEQDPNSNRKVSLLSRASNLVQKDGGQRNAQIPQKNYDRSSKLLNQYIQQSNHQSSQQYLGRDSNFIMSHIDERDEFDEYSHTDSVHSHMLKGAGTSGSKNTSSRGSTLKNQYNFSNTFFTPNQSAKKLSVDQTNQKQTGMTTIQSNRNQKFFGANVNKYPISHSHQQSQQQLMMQGSHISEQEHEDSQVVEDEASATEYATGNSRSQAPHQYVSNKFSQQVTMMNESVQDEPEDPEADIVDDEETGNRLAPDEGFSNGFYDHDEQDPQYIMGRNSRPSAHLQMSSQFSEEIANENEQETHNTFHKMQTGGIVIDDQIEKEAFLQTQKVNQDPRMESQSRGMKQVQSQAVSAQPRSTREINEEHTVQRFIGETGQSYPTSVVRQGNHNTAVGNNMQQMRQSDANSLLVLEQNSSDFSNNQEYLRIQQERLKQLQNDNIDSYVDHSIHYLNHEAQQVLESGPTQRSGALVDNHIQQQPGLQNQFVNLESNTLDFTDRSDPNNNFDESFQNEDMAAQKNNEVHFASQGGQAMGNQGSILTSNNQQLQQTAEFRHASIHSPMQHSGLGSSQGYTRTTQRNPLTMSENTNLEKSDMNFTAGRAYPNNQSIPEQNLIKQNTEESQMADSLEQPQHAPQNQPSSGNPLSQMVTKVPQMDAPEGEDGQTNQQTLHQQHFVQTVQALQFIQNNIRVVEEHEMQDLKVQLAPPRYPDRQKKLAIFDMDETLIHCVDDIETQDPDIVLEIDFPDEETVYAGINIRPFIMECLEEANKHFQVIAFTASHQTYADAILDYIDPNQEFMVHRLYRQHCFLTEEGYYVKDLRIFDGWDLKDVVIIDNSVYSFAFQIDNGIPIIPFYNDAQDEEMMHLVYYLNCLAKADDVREQNRQAFELFKLSNGESLNNTDIAAEADPDQYYEDGEEQEGGYYNSTNILDLTNQSSQNQQQYMNLQDPNQPLQMQGQMMHNTHHSQHPSQYQVDDVIHEDDLENFNSYNESAAHRSKRTTEGHAQQHMSAEEYNRLMASQHQKGSQNTSHKSSMPQQYIKGNKGFEIIDNFQDPTDEESSPILYNDNNNNSKLSGNMQQFNNQLASHLNETFPYTNPSDRELDGNDNHGLNDDSQIINDENSILINDQNEHNQHSRTDTGNVNDPGDDEGGNFYLGSDEENLPPEY